MSLIRKVKFLLDRSKYLYYYFSNKIDNNLIIFESYMGRNYSCNPKYIYQELKGNKNYKFIWAFKNKDNYKFLENKNTSVVTYNTKEYYKAYSKAKYIISNSRIPNYILKKKKQIYIQSWHGTPLKRLGFDLKTNDNAMNNIKDIRKKYKEDSKKYNYLISSSKFCTEKFMSAFNLKNKNLILETGFPRCDYLINYNKKDINKIKEKLNLPKDKKIILYAPTWRDNQHQSALGYTYKLALNFDKLKEQFEKDYIILFRTHYFIENKINLTKYKNFVYDVSNYEDINELYIISDLLITDYSSVFFDYALLNRPIIFYMYDYKEYKNNLRDFYIDLKELPGPITKNEDELLKELRNIKNYNKTYKEKYNKFNNKFNYLHKGDSTRKIIEIINKGSEEI